jgi:hypothetical protein
MDSSEILLPDEIGCLKNFNNIGRPHGAFEGKPPYEALKYTLE